MVAADGLTYIKASALLVPVGETRQEGGVEWVSAGPHRFPVEPIPWTTNNPSVFSTADAPITGGVRVDGNGVEWRSGETPQEPPTLFSTGEYWDAHSHSWQNQSSPCDASVYNGESRLALSSLPSNHRLDDAVVFIDLAGGVCSGVMVGPRDVLTNAHCVTVNDSAMREVDAICSRGNRTMYGGADCVSRNSAGINGAFTVTVNSAWMAGVTNPGTDWALIEWGPYDQNANFDPNIWVNLDVQWLFGARPIPITTRNSASIEATQVGVYGHPVSILTSAGSCWAMQQTGWPLVVADLQSPWGARMVREWRSDHWHSSTRIKTRIDSGGGQSGSPLLQCTQANCANNSEEIVGLHAAYVYGPGLTNYTGGPRANQFAGWVSIFLPGD